jgi:hypothetical protein
MQNLACRLYTRTHDRQNLDIRPVFCYTVHAVGREQDRQPGPRRSTDVVDQVARSGWGGVDLAAMMRVPPPRVPQAARRSRTLSFCRLC